MHADGNNPSMVSGMNMLGPTLDRSVSAFLEDLEQHGMSGNVLLVITETSGARRRSTPAAVATTGRTSARSRSRAAG
jgi:hypothetical protein